MSSLTPFFPAYLLERLAQFPKVQRYWIAYSGGCDSHVLLYAMASLRKTLPKVELHAVHVNHGLQREAEQWVDHCASVCESLNVKQTVLHVDAQPAPGESPEAVARQARYEAFTELLGQGDGLLLAHHQDDQAETLMLQLLRGAGARGLAAMPEHTAFGQGWLGRPLLHVPQAALREYANCERLVWVDDPTNEDIAYDRNFLRREVIPRIRTRWPAMSRTLDRVATHQAEAASLLQELAEQDLDQLEDQAGRLSVKVLQSLSLGRQRNVLRHWLILSHELPLPDTQHINRILHEVIPAPEDAMPCVTWPGGEVRRYQGMLYAGPPQLSHDVGERFDWDMKQPLVVPGLESSLTGQLKPGQGLKADMLTRNGVSVRFRRGGETCRPAGRGHRHQLKKLFQEWGVPPWQRDRVPLLYVNDEIAQVVGYCLCDPFQAQEGESGLVVELKYGSSER